MEGIPLAPTPQGTENAELRSNAELFSTLYRELRELAGRQLRRNAGVAQSPTTLLHEAYLGMRANNAQFPDRARFMAYAARVMRGLIIDFVRERRALKRGGSFEITHLPTEGMEPQADERELVRLSEAIDVLAVREPALAQVVDLKYFCGYTNEEIAALLGVSAKTVYRHWEKARSLLYQQIRSDV